MKGPMLSHFILQTIYGEELNKAFLYQVSKLNINLIENDFKVINGG